jgi:AICAR transformylase/IMP cyclohydrolase PurH
LVDRTNSKHLRELNREFRHSGESFELSQDKLRDSRIGIKGKDSGQARMTDGEPFDAVIVDLYAPNVKIFPESMDIGGMSLIRAAIKNYKNVAVAFDEKSIKDLADEIESNKGATTLAFRLKQAKKAAKFIASRTRLEAKLFEKTF